MESNSSHAALTNDQHSGNGLNTDVKRNFDNNVEVAPNYDQSLKNSNFRFDCNESIDLDRENKLPHRQGKAQNFHPDPSYEVWDINDLSTICTDCTNCTSNDKGEIHDIPSENSSEPTPLVQSDPDTTEYTLDDVIKLLDNYPLQGDEVDYQLNKHLITSNNTVNVMDHSYITVKQPVCAAKTLNVVQLPDPEINRISKFSTRNSDSKATPRPVQTMTRVKSNFALPSGNTSSTRQKQQVAPSVRNKLSKRPKRSNSVKPTPLRVTVSNNSSTFEGD